MSAKAAVAAIARPATAPKRALVVRFIFSLRSDEGLVGVLDAQADDIEVLAVAVKIGRDALADLHDIVVEYPSMFALMMDLQAMGESSAVVGREMGAIRRDVLVAAEAIYRELHGDGDPEGDGRVPATFRLIYMIGWKEGPNQQKPLERGSGMVSIKDILEKEKEHEGSGKE